MIKRFMHSPPQAQATAKKSPEYRPGHGPGTGGGEVFPDPCLMKTQGVESLEIVQIPKLACSY
jgi:hypothetical protein